MHPTLVNLRLLQKLLAAASAIAGIYLLSILVTGGYRVSLALAGVRFEADKLWPAIVATLGFALLSTIFRHGSIAGALRASPRLIVFSLALIVFLANGRTISGGDSVPAKNLPLSILEHGNFYLDQLNTPGAKRPPYYLRRSDGHYVSDYPVGAALLALPFYAPSVLCRVSPGRRIFSELEKVSAATIVALSVVLLYMAAARLAADWMAMLLALIYALGTSSLSVSSQALWQHGPAQLALVAAIYCLARARDDPRWAGYAGLPLGFEVITRPVDAVIAAPLGLYVLVSHRREFLRFIAGAALPLLFQLWYNARYFGTPFRIQFFTEPQTVAGQTVAPGGLWTTPLAGGLALAMLSPGRGLLFYSPIFILSLAGLLVAWRRGGEPILRYLGVGAILTILIVAKWHKTSGGESFGPRLLADLTPIMALALFPLADSLRSRRALKIAFAILAAWSITANAFGAFVGYRGWNTWALDDPATRLWLWSDNPVVDPIRSALDSIRIALGHRPTSRDSPGLLDARFIVLGSPAPDVAPDARIRVALRATNTGSAVWLGGRSSGEPGAVSLGWQLTRDGKPLDFSQGSRELHLNVFPGDSTDLEAAPFAPDAPGRYQLEISLAAATSRHALSPIGSPLLLPVTVAAPSASKGAP